MSPGFPTSEKDTGDERFILKTERNINLMTLGEPSLMTTAQRYDLELLGKAAMGKGAPPTRNWAEELLSGERPLKRVAPDIDDVLTAHGCSSACVVEYAPPQVKAFFEVQVSTMRAISPSMRRFAPSRTETPSR